MRKDISAILAIIVLILGILGLIAIILRYSAPAYILTVPYPLQYWDYLNWIFAILGLIAGPLLVAGSMKESKKTSAWGLGLGIGPWLYYIIFSYINFTTAPIAANMLNAIKLYYLLNLEDIVGDPFASWGPFTTVMMFSILAAVHSGAIVTEKLLILCTYFLIIAVPSIPLAIIALTKT